jgi:hypothetical protein
MPSIRIGFSSDFTLKNQLVGIGTDTADVKLEVSGVLKGDFNISGVTTLTSYGGFFPQKQSGDGVTITGEVNTISEDIIVNVGETFTVSSGSTISIGTLESISIGAHLSVPNGGITLRPQDAIEGTVRFNDDLNTLEFYNGVEWRQFTVTGASGRGVFGGGRIQPAIYISNIDYINISSTGNALSFGTLTTANGHFGGCASETRGVFAGGGPVGTNIIEYVTIASAGNPIDFGDLTLPRTYLHGSCSSSTRGLWFGGEGPTPLSALQNIIDYVQISTIGNAIDFGDLKNIQYGNYALSSPTRGLNASGGPTINGLIEYITISSKGNSVDFGNLTASIIYASACASSTRGIFAGGSTPTTSINTIDFVTIASTGNATNFGTLSVSRNQIASVSSSTRGVFGGGNPDTNIMDYISILSGGQAQDFGDLTAIGRGRASFSDSHGGLGGF